MPTPTRRARILILDDDRDLLETFIAVMEADGYHPTGYSQPELAIAAYRAEDFDLTFVDRNLPGTDGLEIIRRMHSAKPGRIVLFTGDLVPEDDRAARALGAIDCIEKFRTLANIRETIERLIQSGETEKPITPAEEES